MTLEASRIAPVDARIINSNSSFFTNYVCVYCTLDFKFWVLVNVKNKKKGEKKKKNDFTRNELPFGLEEDEKSSRRHSTPEKLNEHEEATRCRKHAQYAALI